MLISAWLHADLYYLLNTLILATYYDFGFTIPLANWGAKLAWAFDWVDRFDNPDIESMFWVCLEWLSKIGSIDKLPYGLGCHETD
jgi:hypothetical protein